MNTNLQTKNRKQSKDPKDGKAKSEDLSLMSAFPKTSASAQTMDLATTPAVAPVVDLATAAAVAPVIASAMAVHHRTQPGIPGSGRQQGIIFGSLPFRKRAFLQKRKIPK